MLAATVFRRTLVNRNRKHRRQKGIYFSQLDDSKSEMVVVKEIIHPGRDSGQPKPGQTVCVHYVGTLTDGTVFDSSRERGKPFSFKIGAGQVIRGWDEGVATMNVGERAKLICPPDYAYGKRGYPGVIPPDSTLFFDVELLRIE